jgi:hypothetical protein
MKSLTEFARKPQLIEIVLDNEDIVKEYGEPIVFYMNDFVDINTYFDFFRSQTDGKNSGLNQVLKRIILNKEGQPVMGDDEALPVDLAIAVLGKVNENLGKSKTKPLMNETGNPQS